MRKGDGGLEVREIQEGPEGVRTRAARVFPTGMTYLRRSVA
jgi:hypothetical protein